MKNKIVIPSLLNFTQFLKKKENSDYSRSTRPIALNGKALLKVS